MKMNELWRYVKTWRNLGNLMLSEKSKSQRTAYGTILFLQNTNFPGGSVGKDSAYNAGDLGLIPRLGRSPGEGNGSSLQYSCLGNPMDRGAWQVTLLRVATVRHGLVLSF